MKKNFMALNELDMKVTPLRIATKFPDIEETVKPVDAMDHLTEDPDYYKKLRFLDL